MNEEKKFGAITSSVDPKKISITVLATARTFAGLLVFAGVMTVGEQTTLLENVNQVVANVLIIVPAAYSAWNAAEVVFGFVQKALVALFKRA